MKRVGPQLAKVLERLGIYTLQDLLLHLPNRYQDRTRIVPIVQLQPGDEAMVEAEVLQTTVQYGRRRSMQVMVSDDSAILSLRFFHFNSKQQAALQPGTKLRCFGEVRRFKRSLEMVHPEYRRVFQDDDDPAAQTLTPIYPLTEGIRQPTLRLLIEQIVSDAGELRFEISEWLPQEALQRLGFPALAQALGYLHKPPKDADLELLAQGQHPAQQRLAFEEILAHHLSLRRLRQKQQRHTAPTMSSDDKLVDALLKSLPFQLTAAQQRVINEICGDLGINQPMQRLVQGDVGSGKTVVAAVAALKAVQCGYQVAVMAPTEILADQHFQNFSQWLQPLGINVQWLTGKTKAKVRQQVLLQIESSEAQVVVGTHALFQEAVQFNNLGLVIIDEQHRFGVHQRLALRNKGRKPNQSVSDKTRVESYPHQLIMTATPIPRTLT
ncbi:ATP-dependent DNA helicase RecG, partial [Kaarinaea lacus]